MRPLVVALLLVCSTAAAAEPTRVLFVTQSVGFRHKAVTREGGQLSPAEIALRDLGQKTGLFTVDATQDVAADFTKENLRNYDVVAFYTTGTLPIAEADRDYFFNDWARQEGHGVLGFHSAMDTYHDYAPYWDLIGGVFIAHAWNAGSTVHFEVHEENPITRPFVDEANADGHFVIKDEIYQYRRFQPGRVRVLMSLDHEHSPTGAPVNTFYGYHVPLAWVRSYGGGKVYCNNLGHNESTWRNQAFLDSITGAVRWVRGEVEVDTTPNPALQAEMEVKSKAAFEAGDFKAAPQDKG